MKSILTVVCLFCSYISSDGASPDSYEYKTYSNFKAFSLRGAKEDIHYVIQEMSNLDDSFSHSISKGETQVLVNPELIGDFNELISERKLEAILLSEDFSKIIQDDTFSRRGNYKEFSWTAYYDVDGIYGFLRNMSAKYPDSTQTIVAGKSYKKRDILGLRINTPTEEIENGDDKQKKDGDKPVVFIESGIHAREWITPATITYFINQLLTSNDSKITELRDKFDWHIFPTVNPDGYHYSYVADRMWRKSRSKSTYRCYGTDLNRNWAHNWGQFGVSHDPCNYQTYCGSKAFSDIETASMKEYISGLENLLAYIGFHADAQMLLVPYSDSTAHEDNYDDLVKIGRTSLEYGFKVNGEKYEGPATAAEVLYKASGGSMDWVREALGTRLVYTYELRGNMFHWAASRINEQGDEVTQMMLGLFTEACQLGYC